MESNIRAFFYEYKYYLLPSTVEHVNELETGVAYSLKRLNEELCMAPNFIYESITDETLTISEPERAFDVRVNLYTSREYDERLLAVVNQVCRGCARYEDNGTDDLDGHHREIGLDGCCYEREEEGDEWSFALCTHVFWSRMSDDIEELAACIDKGDQTSLNRMINEQLEQFFTSVRVYGTHEGEKYHLYFSTPFYMDALIACVLRYLVRYAEKCEGAISTWEVHSFLPAGVLVPDADVYGLAQLSFSLTEDEGAGSYMVAVVSPTLAALDEEAREEVFAALYDQLCHRLGEQVLSDTVCGLDILPTAELTMSWDALAVVLQDQYDGDVVRHGGNAPEMPSVASYRQKSTADSKAHPERSLPYREHVTEGLTAVPEVSCLFATDLAEEMPWWTSCVSYSYLFFPCAERNAVERLGIVQWYLANRKMIPAPIRTDEVRPPAGIGIGVAGCEGYGVIMDSLVMDEQMFFDILRRMAPVLRAYNAKLVLVNADGVHVYECGYRMEEIDYKR